jgi:hypothetical protein
MKTMKLFTLLFAIFFLSIALSAQTLSLGNNVWWDLNDNGKKDAGEPGMSSVTVTLYQDNNNDGVADAGFTPLVTSTNGSGAYNFTNLNPGSYFVKVDAGWSHYVSTRFGGDPDNDIDNDNNGYTQDLSTFRVTSQTITLVAGTEADGTGATNTNTNNTLDIGAWKSNGLGDHVWLDNNANGMQDAGEPGLANVTVKLKNTSGATYATTTTDANGDYYFYDPIVYGFIDYVLEFIPPSGYKSTHCNKGGDDEKDSDMLNGVITGANVPAGRWNHSFDAGFVPNSVILPITLASFNATLTNNNKVDLRWVTTSEVNVNYFAVERSLDGINFSDASLVFALGSTTSENKYSFSDNITSVSSPVIYYRLRSVDNDGKTQLSEIRMIKLIKQIQNNISILTYPNPVTNELRITIPAAWQNKTVVYEVIALNGQTASKTAKANAGQTETTDVSRLQSGIYTVRVSCDGQTAAQKIVKH